MVPERGDVRSRLVPTLAIEPDCTHGDKELPDPLGEILVEVRLLADTVHVSHVGSAVALGLHTAREKDAGDGPVPEAAVRRELFLLVAVPEVHDRHGLLSPDELPEGF